MNVLILIITILSALAGASKGITDSIVFHDAYKGKGYWWSLDSWNMKYNRVNKWSFKFGVSLNAWHIFDWTRNLCALFAMLLAYYCPSMLPIEWLAFGGFQVFFFLVFFKIFYR